MSDLNFSPIKIEKLEKNLFIFLIFTHSEVGARLQEELKASLLRMDTQEEKRRKERLLDIFWVVMFSDVLCLFVGMRRLQVL